MIKQQIKRALYLLIIIISTMPIHSAYGNANALLDIALLTKKDGKAVVLLFNNPIKKKAWKIKFKGKKIDIILYGFTDKSDGLKPSLNIPGLKNINILKSNKNITISISLKKEIKSLISNHYITFLTKNPYMLGIVFTNTYIKKYALQNNTKDVNKPSLVQNIFKENLTTSTKQKLATDKDNVNKEKKENFVKIKNSNIAKANKSSNIVEMPFIKYEDIFAPDKKEQTNKKDNKNINSKNKSEELPKKTKIITQTNGKNSLKKTKYKKKYNFDLTISPKSKENSTNLFRVIASLSAVLGIVLVTLFLWKKLLFLKYKGKQDIIDIIGIHHFSSRQSIAIVKIGKDKFLLGITPENISLLAKLNIAENSQDSIITNYNENENNPLEQKAVNLIKEKFGKLKRL